MMQCSIVRLRETMSCGNNFIISQDQSRDYIAACYKKGEVL